MRFFHHRFLQNREGHHENRYGIKIDKERQKKDRLHSSMIIKRLDWSVGISSCDEKDLIIIDSDIPDIA